MFSVEYNGTVPEIKDIEYKERLLFNTAPKKIKREWINRILERLDQDDIITFQFVNEISEEYTNTKKINIYRRLEILLGDWKYSYDGEGDIEKLYNVISNKYYEATLEHATNVGIKAAESIAEGITQTNLNTFHFAGQKHIIGDIIKKMSSLITGSSISDKDLSMRIQFKNSYSIGRDSKRLTIDDIFSLKSLFKYMTLDDYLYKSDDDAMKILLRRRSVRNVRDNFKEDASSIMIFESLDKLENVEDLYDVEHPEIISLKILRIYDGLNILTILGDLFDEDEDKDRNEDKRDVLYLKYGDNYYVLHDDFEILAESYLMLRNENITDMELLYDSEIQRYYEKISADLFIEQYWHTPSIYPNLGKSIYVLRIKLDNDKLFAHRITPNQISSLLKNRFGDEDKIVAIPSPILDGRFSLIHIFTVTMVEYRELKMSRMRLFNKIKADTLIMGISGIQGIYEIYPMIAKMMSIVWEPEDIIDSIPDVDKIEYDQWNYLPTDWDNVINNGILVENFIEYLRELGFDVKTNNFDINSLEYKFYSVYMYPKGFYVKILDERYRDMTPVEYITMVENEDDYYLDIGTHVFATTSGSNIVNILEFDFIDRERTTTNNLEEVVNIFGLMEARKSYYKELSETLSISGLVINPSHIYLLADEFFSNGRMLGAKFSDPTQHRCPSAIWYCRTAYVSNIFKIAMFGISESADTASGSLFVGDIPSLGAGAIQTTEELKEYKNELMIKDYVAYTRRTGNHISFEEYGTTWGNTIVTNINENIVRVVQEHNFYLDASDSEELLNRGITGSQFFIDSVKDIKLETDISNPITEDVLVEEHKMEDDIIYNIPEIPELFRGIITPAVKLYNYINNIDELRVLPLISKGMISGGWVKTFLKKDF